MTTFPHTWLNPTSVQNEEEERISVAHPLASELNCISVHELGHVVLVVITSYSLPLFTTTFLTVHITVCSSLDCLLMIEQCTCQMEGQARWTFWIAAQEYYWASPVSLLQNHSYCWSPIHNDCMSCTITMHITRRKMDIPSWISWQF